MLQSDIFTVTLIPWVDDIEYEIHEIGRKNLKVYEELQLYPYIQLAVNDDLMATPLAQDIMRKIL